MDTFDFGLDVSCRMHTDPPCRRHARPIDPPPPRLLQKNLLKLNVPILFCDACAFPPTPPERPPNTKKRLRSRRRRTAADWPRACAAVRPADIKFAYLRAIPDGSLDAAVDAAAAASPGTAEISGSPTAMPHLRITSPLEFWDQVMHMRPVCT